MIVQSAWIGVGREDAKERERGKKETGRREGQKRDIREMGEEKRGKREREKKLSSDRQKETKYTYILKEDEKTREGWVKKARLNSGERN